MSMEDQRPTIPPELENMLLEFTVNVLIEKPGDMVSYAADYFTKLRDKRTEGNEAEPTDVHKADEPEEISEFLGHRQARRASVMGERYNPEEDFEDDVVEIHPKTDEQRKRIKAQSEDVFLFRILDDIDLGAVIDAMIPIPVVQGQTIIQQGDDGDYFYLIDDGTFDILIKDQSGEEKHVGNYEGKGYFGELALLHNQPRAATIRAITDGHLWAVGRQTFNRLIVKRAFEKRQLYLKLLNGVPQLEPLSEYEKMQVADALKAKSYREGDIIFNEGDEGDGMYFIIEGKVGVWQKSIDGNEDTEVAQLGEGEYFGELAIVKHQPRAATVVAMEDTKTAFLEVKGFERLLGPCLEIMERHAESYK